jgi:hypothetical protein
VVPVIEDEVEAVRLYGLSARGRVPVTAGVRENAVGVWCRHGVSIEVECPECGPRWGETQERLRVLNRRAD